MPTLAQDLKTWLCAAVCLWDHTDTLQEMNETTSNDLMLYTDIYNAN